jgi:hypothetical protein
MRPPRGLAFLEPAAAAVTAAAARCGGGTWVHKSPVHCGSEHGSTARSTRGQGLTLVPISAQFELTPPLSAQLKLVRARSPICKPKTARGCVPKVLELSSNVSVVFPKVLKLSCEVSESKPLPEGAAPPRPHLQRHRRHPRSSTPPTPTRSSRPPLSVETRVPTPWMQSLSGAAFFALAAVILFERTALYKRIINFVLCRCSRLAGSLTRRRHMSSRARVS